MIPGPLLSCIRLSHSHCQEKAGPHHGGQYHSIDTLWRPAPSQKRGVQPKKLTELPAGPFIQFPSPSRIQLDLDGPRVEALRRSEVHDDVDGRAHRRLGVAEEAVVPADEPEAEVLGGPACVAAHTPKPDLGPWARLFCRDQRALACSITRFESDVPHEREGSNEPEGFGTDRTNCQPLGQSI